VSNKLVLTVLMLSGALACIGLSITLFSESFSRSSSLFTTAMESMQGGDDLQQYLAMVSMAFGVGILVFVKKYWS